jgi:hypothetical protein
MTFTGLGIGFVRVTMAAVVDSPPAPVPFGSGFHAVIVTVPGFGKLLGGTDTPRQGRWAHPTGFVPVSDWVVPVSGVWFQVITESFVKPLPLT